jgi:hypothetical protein
LITGYKFFDGGTPESWWSMANGKKLDIHAELAKRREIAVVWAVEDVQSVRPDLGDGQAWEVLQRAKRFHDASIGINWEVLECTAQILFGEAVKSPSPEKQPLPSPSQIANQMTSGQAQENGQEHDRER